jgi:D-glycero-D-manno-heptose 1,7-bisphosphate phosphatase
MTKLILLDRDGVINFDSPDYIKGPAEWRPLPGSLEAIAQLRGAGYLVGICSNQAGVARGKLSDTDLDAIHDKMLAAVAQAGGDLNAVQYCRHHPDTGCKCRKGRNAEAAAILLTELRIYDDLSAFVQELLR